MNITLTNSELYWVRVCAWKHCGEQFGSIAGTELVVEFLTFEYTLTLNAAAWHTMVKGLKEELEEDLSEYNRTLTLTILGKLNGHALTVAVENALAEAK